jgi:hypothetical protein
VDSVCCCPRLNCDQPAECGFFAYKKLSASDLLPVIVIALVSFLIKTGVLSAAVIGIKKLWEWIRKK